MKKFTEISKNACQKKLCWKLTCTTCGSSELMAEFTKAVFGNDHKKLDRFSHNNSLIDQEKMLKFFADEIDILELKNESCFPDWLGHIGLLISSCQKAEDKNFYLAQKLYPQFLELVNDRAKEYIYLRIKENKPLDKDFLGRMEGGLSY